VVAIAALAALRYTRELRTAQEEVVGLNTSLEERVKVRTADLAQANDEIQRFAYIVTHDLRAPLVNIMGFTSELETSVEVLRTLVERSEAEGKGSDPIVREASAATKDDLPEAIRFIRSSTKKMDNLINAILKLSREGRRVPRPEIIRLDEVIDASVSALRHQVEEADGLVTVEVDVPTMLGDRLSLEQVVGNLLDNAIKYRSRDRPLRITVRAASVSKDQVSIEVSDNGRGIADQDRERIFELFRRSGAQDQPGEGIGLAFVRAVVRNLGGEVTVSSALDVGTTFRVIVPLNLSTAGS
jgi:signal transduction histidine kinase